jgi:poly(beta-D-mannuronate) lyase
MAEGTGWLGRRAAAVRCLATALVLLVPFVATAAPGDGFYSGTVVCEAASASPGFTMSVAFAVRDGRFTVVRGTPGRDGFEQMDGRLTPDGMVRIDGSYIADTRKPLAYVGRLDGGRIVASGPRGPRRCEMAVNGVPPSGARPPFSLPPDPAVRRAAFGRPATAPFACPRPPAPVRDIIVEPFYRKDDPTGSIIDPVAFAARTAAVAPLSAMDSGAVRLADRHLGTSPRDPAIAACLVAWIDGWARARAMLGTVTGQGGFERKWTLVSLALAYATLADATEIPQEARDRIARWLADVGWAVVPHYARRPFAEQNNHLNWAALAAIAAGAASGDANLFDWGIAAARGALGVVAADGALAMELDRKSKALHYHKFSIEPLVLADAIAAANGIDLAAANGGALHRLAAFTLAGFDDPDRIARRVGAAQTFVGADRITPSMFAWAEIYAARHPTPSLAARLDAIRPRDGFFGTWLGGNVTLRFAATRP